MDTVRIIATIIFQLIFFMLLQKTKFKDDSSNDTDWVHDLRIILIAAQKN